MIPEDPTDEQADGVLERMHLRLESLDSDADQENTLLLHWVLVWTDGYPSITYAYSSRKPGRRSRL